MKVLRLLRLEPADGIQKTYGTLTIPPSGWVVYGGGRSAPTHRQVVSEAISAGELRGISVEKSSVLSTEDTLNEFAYICDEASGYDFSSFMWQINWNIAMSPQLIAIVRGEMLGGSLTALGLSAPAMLSKLQGVVGAIQVGMFQEAAYLLAYGLARDAFLTNERVAGYCALLLSSDAIS